MLTKALGLVRDRIIVAIDDVMTVSTLGNTTTLYTKEHLHGLRTRPSLVSLTRRMTIGSALQPYVIGVRHRALSNGRYLQRPL